MATIRERKGTDGKLAYTARVRMKGAAEQSATFGRLTDAKRWIQDTESAIRDGRNSNASEAKRHTLSEAIDRYIRDVLPLKRQNKQHSELPYLERWRTELGSLTLADVKRSAISDVRDKLLNETTRFGTKRTGAHVNRILGVLSHLFSKAEADWGWIETHPMRKKITKPKESQPRVRYLSDDERERLLIACKKSECEALYPAVILSLATGMRKGELFGLRWRDVDFGRGLITLGLVDDLACRRRTANAARSRLWDTPATCSNLVPKSGALTLTTFFPP